MKCSVDGCTKDAKHDVKIQADTMVGVKTMDAHLCYEHRDILVKGRAHGYSMGCSYKEDEGVCY